MLRVVLIVLIAILSFSTFAKDTELKLYRPFVDEATVIIKQKLIGECWQQSQRIKREDAWRCVAEKKVYDPCFVKPYGSQKIALCPQSPWEAESVEINMATSVDSSQNAALDMSEAFPWAVELTTGERCLAVNAGEEYDGLQVHYRCNSSTILIGRVQRCSSLWKILQKNAHGVSTASVEKAWF